MIPLRKGFEKMFLTMILVCGVGLISLGLYKGELMAAVVGAVILLALWVMRRAPTGNHQHTAAKIRAELIEKAAEDQEKKIGEANER